MHAAARSGIGIPLVTILVTLLLAAPALAHVPDLEGTSEGTATPIEGPEVSRAIYGFIAPGETGDAYSFTVNEAVTRTIGVIVPAYPEHAGFRPTLSVSPEGRPGVEIPDPRREPRPREFEPFSLTYFWSGGEREVSFEPGVRYTVRVEPGPGEDGGRYVIVFGGPERFEGRDTVATLRRLPLIWFGAYGGAPARFNALALIPLGVVALLFLAVAFAVFRLVSRRAHPA